MEEKKYTVLEDYHNALVDEFLEDLNDIMWGKIATPKIHEKWMGKKY